MKRIGALLVGMTACLFLIEAGLRVAGLFWPQGPVRKTSEKDIRILCFGDSFTYGEGAGVENSYPAQLEQMLKRGFPRRSFEVMNLGVPGHNSYQTLKKIKQALPLYQPDMVLILTGLNNTWNPPEPANWILKNMSKLRTWKFLKILFLNLTARASSGEKFDKEWLLREWGEEASLAARGDYKSAQEKLEQRATREAGNFWVHWNLGYLYLFQNRPAIAEKEFKAALQINPLSAGAHRFLGWCYKKQGKLQMAEKHYRKAIRLNPLALSALQELGEIYHSLGKHKEAEKIQKGVKRALTRIKKDLMEMIEVCHVYNSHVLLLNYPRWPENVNQVIKKVSGKSSLPLADIYNRFQKGPQDCFLPDGHPDREGYRIMADEIFRTIKEEWLKR